MLLCTYTTADSDPKDQWKWEVIETSTGYQMSLKTTQGKYVGTMTHADWELVCSQHPQMPKNRLANRPGAMALGKLSQWVDIYYDYQIPMKGNGETKIYTFVVHRAP